MSIMLAGLLVGEWFLNLPDTKRKTESSRQEYNTERPHRTLADRAPAEFAADCSHLLAQSSGLTCGIVVAIFNSPRGTKGSLQSQQGVARACLILTFASTVRGRAVMPVLLVLQKFPTGFEGISRRRR